MPKENIERAMNGKNIDANKLQAVTYEGFGPGSCAIIVECLTDNKKRTVSETRHIFSKGMGNLGSVGCASRLFNYIGTVTVRTSLLYSPQLPKGDNQDRIYELAIDAGADDVVEDEEENCIIVECKPNLLHAIQTAFKKEKLDGKMELTYKPIVHPTILIYSLGDRHRR